MAWVLIVGCASPPQSHGSPEWTTRPSPSVSSSGAPLQNIGTFESLDVGGRIIDISIPSPLAVSIDAIRQWVQRAAVAVSEFYGRYPVKHATITIFSAAGGRVQEGQESGGMRIIIGIGSRTRPADLLSDWELTHEMFHLSQPSLDRDYSWMSEGMADYLEPVARVRIGQITPEKFWKDFVEGLPQGLPEPGDKGLDGTQDWGRTYWGGCLFWLLADVRIRQQTHNQSSVRDAAMAVLDAGGDGSQDWSINKLLGTYDLGTGTHVFTTLHNELGGKPGTTDLNQLWKSLGVIYKNGRVTFDNTAPLASIRQGITTKDPSGIPPQMKVP
jgi:hypothetical protein